MSVQITRVSVALKCIRECKHVYVQPRFGLSERWIKVTKVEALKMFDGYTDNDTPHDAEMYAGYWGLFDYENNEKVFYLG